MIKWANSRHSQASSLQRTTRQKKIRISVFKSEDFSNRNALRQPIRLQYPLPAIKLCKVPKSNLRIRLKEIKNNADEEASSRSSSCAPGKKVRFKVTNNGGRMINQLYGFDDTAHEWNKLVSSCKNKGLFSFSCVAKQDFKKTRVSINDICMIK